MYQNCAAAVAVVIKMWRQKFSLQKETKIKIRKTRFGWRFYRPEKKVPKNLLQRIWEELGIEIDIKN